MKRIQTQKVMNEDKFAMFVLTSSKFCSSDTS